MGREINLGDVVIDQFSVFASDGYTKVSGETVFTATVWKNGVVDGASVSIAEIGTSGEYKTEFTPDDEGFWTLEILIDYNDDIYFGEYTLVQPTTSPVTGGPFDPLGVLP